MGETGDKVSNKTMDKWGEVEYAENVFVNILSRLPVKLLLACKSVCKHWRQVISSQAFIDLQLLWSKKHPVYIVYPFMNLVMELNLIDNGEITKRLTFPYFSNLCPLTIVCSVDGLLCLINHTWKEDSGKIVEDKTDLQIRICNPATRNALLLPKGSPSGETPSIGVAFGPRTNEYKIFRFFCAKRISHAGHQSRGSRRQCEVYSSSTGFWSVIGRAPHYPMRSSHSPMGSTNHVFANGMLYWFIASDTDDKIPGLILTVDMEQNFGTIDLPLEVTEHSYLVSLEGRLSLVVVYDEDETVNIWVLEDENEWELKCSVNVPFPNNECTEFVGAREQEIFFVTSNYYYIYDLDRMSWSELNLPSISEKSYPVAFAYTESLLSCGGRVGLEI
ncbi:hypothetical protein COLO4_09573 [Corchorus olitorius]|uniref:F-box domain-containing protein n=1 Tax=Corchorus olitorius TaxID=93759 RepID=A0A1R3KBT1_9ROSI|nr:hypothetical protein COLO4_09573 [Corchorus olitorius]